MMGRWEGGKVGRKAMKTIEVGVFALAKRQAPEGRPFTCLSAEQIATLLDKKGL